MTETVSAGLKRLSSVSRLRPASASALAWKLTLRRRIASILERGLAVLVADDVAEDLAEQADIVVERLVPALSSRAGLGCGISSITTDALAHPPGRNEVRPLLQGKAHATWCHAGRGRGAGFARAAMSRPLTRSTP